MIAEFFGLPGSGKTLLAKRFSKENRIPIIEINSRIEKYFWAVFFVCTHPVLFFLLLKKIIKENKNDSALLRHKALFLCLRAIAKEGKSFFKRDAVIDEGLYQTLLYIFERKIKKDELASYRTLFKKRTVHIIVAGVDTRMERMQSRGRVPRVFLNNAYRERWFPVLEHNFYVITVWIKENFSYEETYND